MLTQWWPYPCSISAGIEPSSSVSKTMVQSNKVNSGKRTSAALLSHWNFGTGSTPISFVLGQVGSEDSGRIATYSGHQLHCWKPCQLQHRVDDSLDSLSVWRCWDELSISKNFGSKFSILAALCPSWSPSLHEIFVQIPGTISPGPTTSTSSSPRHEGLCFLGGSYVS